MVFFSLFQTAARKLAIKEWKRLEMAGGTATNGSEKLARAKTTPKPEFCIPTSMEIVRERMVSLVIFFTKRKPQKKPETWSRNTLPMSTTGDSKILSREDAIIEDTIKIISTIEVKGAKSLK